MPSVIQRATEILRIRSVAPVDVPSTRTRNVPEGRAVLREGFLIETTRIPPTTPATQRRTCSLGDAAVCAPPSPSMKRSIAAKPMRDEPTTIKRCADDMAWARAISPDLPERFEPGWVRRRLGFVGSSLHLPVFHASSGSPLVPTLEEGASKSAVE